MANDRVRWTNRQPAKAAQKPGEGEAVELGPGAVDPERLGPALVLAQRHERPPRPAPAQTGDREDHQHEADEAARGTWSRGRRAR